MIFVMVRYQSADADDRVVDVLWEFVAHCGANFRGGLVQQTISGCETAYIGYCLDIPERTCGMSRALFAEHQYKASLYSVRVLQGNRNDSRS